MADRMSERQMRRITAQQMYAVEPEPLSPEDANILEAHRRYQAEVGEPTARKIAGAPFGITSVADGVGNIARGYEEGNVARGVGGAGQVVLGAIPGLSVVRTPVQAGINYLMATLPRAGAVTAGLGAPIAYADDAEAGEKNAAAAVAGSAEVQRLRSAIEQAERERVDSAKTPIRGMSPAGAEDARKRADAAIEQRISRLRGELREAEDRERVTYSQNAPFRERYPGAAGTIAAAGFGVAGGWGAAKGMGKSIVERRRGKRLDAATDDFERAALNLQNADSSTLMQAAQAQDLVRRRLASYERGSGSVAGATTTVGNALKGGVIGAEASAIPEQYDYITHSPGHPARERAAAEFARPSYYYERAAPAVLGASAATLAGSAGRGLTAGGGPDIDRARRAAELGREPGIVASWMGRRSQLDDDIDRMRRISAASTPSARAGPVPGGQPAGGGAQLGGSPPPQPLPLPNNPGTGAPPPFAAYDPSTHGAVSRQYLDDLLTQANATRANPLTPDIVDRMAREVAARHQLRGLPQVDPAGLRRRAGGTADELRHIDSIARTTGRGTVTAPAIRPNVLSASTGRPGTLAVPLAVGAGLGASAAFPGDAQAQEFASMARDAGFSPDEIDRLMQTYMQE